MLGLLLAAPGVGSIISAGSAVFGAILRCTVCMIAIAIVAAFIAGDIRGKHRAEAACEAENLAAQLAAKNADLANARKAAADAAFRAATIQKDADDEKQRMETYVAELQSRPAPACNLTDADLRGMRHQGRRTR